MLGPAWGGTQAPRALLLVPGLALDIVGVPVLGCHRRSSGSWAQSCGSSQQPQPGQEPLNSPNGCSTGARQSLALTLLTFRRVCIAFPLLVLHFENGNIFTSLADAHFFCIN